MWYSSVHVGFPHDVSTVTLFTSQSSPTETAASPGCIQQKVRLEREVYKGNSASVESNIGGQGKQLARMECKGLFILPNQMFLSTKLLKLASWKPLSHLFLESAYWAANVLAVKTRGWDFISPSYLWLWSHNLFAIRLPVLSFLFHFQVESLKWT